MIDPRSIIFILAALSLLMSVVLFAMPASIRDRIGGARHWSMAMLLLAGASLLFALRDIIPDLLSITIANIASLTSVAMIYAGSRAFFDLRPRNGVLAAAVIITCLTMIACTYFVDLFAMRVVIFSALSGALLFLYGLDVSRRRPRQSGRAAFPYLFTSVTVFFDVLISCLRIVNAIRMPDPGSSDFFAPTLINVLYYSTHSLLAFCISVGFILMLNERLHAMLEHQLSHDPLTNAYARTIVIEMTQRALASGRSPVSLLLLDIDHFKQVNDDLGHQAGDAVLKHVVNTLADSLRPDEPLGRYGGEEFILLLRGAAEAQALRVAERLRERVAGTPYPHGETARPITLSIGCATATSGETLEQLLHRADAALYRAKRAGRNQVAQG
ncbi:GGDEF domain-containing protein [Pseudomonas sp. PDM14]|uniref:GGDEF domain-containing protein n=1 Tax=Pseudomonas sp. PDM14 TaxID=2769288 RepID=UPI00177D1AC4|nr:GGDEF domain-containing protein [Pseudomonas sp. PDM14]MBD9483004.1 GGDEF domain-containing protein [Pseudomonas sp. PDM14]